MFGSRARRLSVFVQKLFHLCVMSLLGVPSRPFLAILCSPTCSLTHHSASSTPLTGTKRNPCALPPWSGMSGHLANSIQANVTRTVRLFQPVLQKHVLDVRKLHCFGILYERGHTSLSSKISATKKSWSILCEPCKLDCGHHQTDTTHGILKHETSTLKLRHLNLVLVKFFAHSRCHPFNAVAPAKSTITLSFECSERSQFTLVFFCI